MMLNIFVEVEKSHRQSVKLTQFLCVFFLLLVSEVPIILLLYDWVPYHCWGGGGGLFFIFGFQPPRSVSLALLDSSYPVVLPTSNMNAVMQWMITYIHTCNYYPTTNSTSNDDSYQNKLRTDMKWAPIFQKGPALTHL